MIASSGAASVPGGCTHLLIYYAGDCACLLSSSIMAMRVQLSTASLDGESGYHPMDAKGELFDETVNEEVVPERMQYSKSSFLLYILVV